MSQTWIEQQESRLMQMIDSLFYEGFEADDLEQLIRILKMIKEMKDMNYIGPYVFQSTEQVTPPYTITS